VANKEIMADGTTEAEGKVAVRAAGVDS